MVVVVGGASNHGIYWEANYNHMWTVETASLFATAELT